MSARTTQTARTTANKTANEAGAENEAGAAAATAHETATAPATAREPEPAAAPEADGDLTLLEFAVVNERRASSYALLSRLFAEEVDQSLLDELHATRFPMGTGNAKSDEGNRLMAGFLSRIWGGTLHELAVDYVHCFIGSGDDAFSAAYPFESVYTSPRRLMMQEARDEVLAVYRSQGFDKAPGWKESEDHVAAELEFMAGMATRTAHACREGDPAEAAALLRTQRGFLDAHLFPWTGMLTGDMRMYAHTDFYRGISLMLDGALETDVELLAQVLGEEEPAAEEPAASGSQDSATAGSAGSAA